MSQIRIKSNPYKKEISYEYFDENASKFIEINYDNSPSSKLVSENYKNALLNMKGVTEEWAWNRVKNFMLPN